MNSIINYSLTNKHCIRFPFVFIWLHFPIVEAFSTFYVFFLSTVAENSAREHLIETGEITPFDAVNLKNDFAKKNLVEKDITSNHTNHIKQARNDNVLRIEPKITELSLIDRIKASSREAHKSKSVLPNVQKLATRKRKKKSFVGEDTTDEDDDDEDFIPSQDEDEDDFDDNGFVESDEILPREKKSSVTTRNSGSSKISKQKTKIKKNKKTVDDGNFDNFRERLR